ncbi:hypothetical protein TNCV_4804941 [Trichonephila clavipes]|nr:hypothetical protein TNCV_4804941 [Trichonephila clavipes]
MRFQLDTIGKSARLIATVTGLSDLSVHSPSPPLMVIAVSTFSKCPCDHGSLVIKVTWLVCHEFELNAVEDLPCRGYRCAKNLSKLKHLPVEEWKGPSPAAKGDGQFAPSLG